LLAVLLLLPVPTGAKSEVPFRAIIQTEIVMTGACGVACVSLDITGAGTATHMGKTHVSGPSQVDFVSFVQTGTSTLTAANGDTILISFSGSFVPQGPDPAGPVSFEGTWQAISGTGRFEAASASGTYSGSAAMGSGILVLEGTVEREH
jgi:hypothetical protein